MANQQYDVSKKLQRLFKEKQKIREAVREMVLKREGNPYIQPSTLFDPAIVKYHAMLSYRADYIRPTPKNITAFCGFIVFPILGTFFYLYNHDKKKEKLLRSGKLTYEERYRYAYL